MPQDLEVTSVNVSALLEKLRNREWVIPAFQRGFVWSIGDISDLVYSILERRPIGMATLWQQPDGSTLQLEPISIPDRDRPAELPKPESVSATRYAVLDGRQRCTAIAMAFGGLRPIDGRMKYCGRFFLNLAAKDDARRIEYVKESDAVNRGITSDAGAIGQGLFPLSSSNPKETLSDQWFRYAQAIQDRNNYPDSELPDAEELRRRNDILRRSSEGLMSTKLAVNIVPSSYSLVDVCGIFEVLNTSGTKVSTVDLIHSWLYADTSGDESPLLLRDWMDKLGDQHGAVGWSSSTDRPELIAQMTTATYVSLESKPEPRTVGRTQRSSVASVKSGDLLATPTSHWKNVIAREDQFADYLGDFQQCVADGAFGWQACPYPRDCLHLRGPSVAPPLRCERESHMGGPRPRRTVPRFLLAQRAEQPVRPRIPDSAWRGHRPTQAHTQLPLFIAEFRRMGIRGKPRSRCVHGQAAARLERTSRPFQRPADGCPPEGALTTDPRGCQEGSADA